MENKMTTFVLFPLKKNVMQILMLRAFVFIIILLGYTIKM